MENDYYNVSSVRLMRYLYALGFDKENYINNKGKENWRFKEDYNNGTYDYLIKYIA